MTPIEWSKVKERIEALYGKSPKWANATALTNDVHSIPLAAAMTAIEDSMGQYAPSPAEIITKARAQLLPQQPVHTTPGQEECPHPIWAIVEYLTDGRRRGFCSVCKLEEVRPADRMMTPYELEDRRLKSQQQEVY